MKDATQKGRKDSSPVEHKGAVQKPRTQEQRPVVKGKNSSSSSPSSRSIPKRDKKTGRFLKKKK